MKISFAKSAVALAVGFVALSANAASVIESGSGSSSFSTYSGLRTTGLAYNPTGTSVTNGPTTVSVAQWDAASYAGMILSGVEFRVKVLTGSFTWTIDNDGASALNGGQAIGGSNSYAAEGVGGLYAASYAGSTAGNSTLSGVAANDGDAVAGSNLTANFQDTGADSKTGTSTDTNGTGTWTTVGAGDWAAFEGAGSVDFDFFITQATTQHNVTGLLYKFDTASNYQVDVKYTYTSAVPEPEGYALMLAGLAAVGAMSRRRRLG